MATESKKKIKVWNFHEKAWEMRDAGQLGYIQTLAKIGPALAKRFLASQTNRPLKIARVRQMVRDMKSNNWRLSTDQIAFSADGKFRNGQHRLHAIIESGTEQVFSVLFGSSDEDAEKYDCGSSRTLYDVSILDGMQVHPFAVSVGRFIRRQTIQFLPRQATRAEEINFIKEYLPQLELVRSWFRPENFRKSKVIGFNIGNDVGAAFARAAYVFQTDKARMERLKTFATGLINGETFKTLISSKDPADSAFALFVGHMNTDDSQGQKGRDRRYRKAEKAIFFFVNSKETKVLREAHDEMFLLSCEFEAKNAGKKKIND